jgi:hypothetical protein
MPITTLPFKNQLALTTKTPSLTSSCHFFPLTFFSGRFEVPLLFHIGKNASARNFALKSP